MNNNIQMFYVPYYICNVSWVPFNKAKHLNHTFIKDNDLLENGKPKHIDSSNTARLMLKARRPQHINNIDFSDAIQWWHLQEGMRCPRNALWNMTHSAKITRNIPEWGANQKTHAPLICPSPLSVIIYSILRHVLYEASIRTSYRPIAVNIPSKLHSMLV